MAEDCAEEEGEEEGAWDGGDGFSDPEEEEADGSFRNGKAGCSSLPVGAGLLALLLALVGPVLRRRESLRG